MNEAESGRGGMLSLFLPWLPLQLKEMCFSEADRWFNSIGLVEALGYEGRS